MRRLRTRHPNRAGLRVVDGRDADRGTSRGTDRGTDVQRAGTPPACRCPTRTVAAPDGAYDRQLGWHPSYWPTA